MKKFKMTATERIAIISTSSRSLNFLPLPGYSLFINHPADALTRAMDAYCEPLDWSLLNGGNTKDSSIWSCGYAQYPISKFMLEEGELYFEGYAYNRSPIDIGRACVEKLLEADWKAVSEIIADTDGEFLITYYHRPSEKWFIVNDSWGRLPVYCALEQQRVAISRDIGILKNLGFTGIPAKISIAEYMLFGYNLGSSTLWPAITKLEPHTILEIDESTCAINRRSFFRTTTTTSPEKSAAGLRNTISKALSNRLAALPNSCLSLSGGLDSRLIAGVLSAAGHQIPARTFVRVDDKSSDDLEGATRIVDALVWKDWASIQLSETGMEDLRKLAHLKPGLNTLSMAWLLPYLRFMATRNWSLITGDGGDKFLVDTRPLNHVSDKKGFIQYLLKFHGKSSLKEASQISGCTKDEILWHLSEYFDSYTGNDYSLWHRQFLFRERAINWLFEGEDRNRCFAWSTSPFYSPEVITEAMYFSDAEKARGKLFSAVFRELPGGLETIVNPNWQLAPNEKARVQFLLWKQGLKAYLPLWKQGLKFKEFHFHEELIRLKNQHQKGIPAISLFEEFSEAQWYDLLTMLAAFRE